MTDKTDGARGSQLEELGPQGRRTRRRLLRAGREVLAERGYHGTRVDDVVKLAGTSHGTFYLYFDSKQGLLDALREETDQALNELSDALPDLVAGEDGQTAFRDWIAAFAELYQEHGAVIGADIARHNASEAPLEALDILGGLRDKLKQAIETADCEVAAEIAALAIVAMLERFAYFSPDVIASNDGQRDAALDTLTRLSHSGLFA